MTENDTTGIDGPEITLRFRAHGDAYERAQRVAERMGLDIQAYLLLCISHGHAALAARVDPGAELDRPTVERWQELGRQPRRAG